MYVSYFISQWSIMYHKLNESYRQLCTTAILVLIL